MEECIYSEEQLKVYSIQIKSGEKNILEFLIDLIPEKNRNYDWNVGSILQYFDAELIVDAVKKLITYQDYIILLAYRGFLEN